MKIIKVETIPIKNPSGSGSTRSDALHSYKVGGRLLTRIYTDEGITGSSVIGFGRIESGVETVKVIIDKGLSELLIGQDPHMVRKIRNDMFVATEYYGTVGLASFAISAIDNALWDIIGKAAGLPTAMVLGARRTEIPVYAMAGWYYEGGMPEFIKRCEKAAEDSYKAVKIKVGRDSLADDVERIKAIRKTLGEEFRIMVDANCSFDENEALRRGHAYEELGVYWFEEPVQPYMRDSYARLKDKLRMPIAAGENNYTRHQFYDLIRSGCVSIVQPDNRRAGGVTEWMDIGAISEVAGCKLASHGCNPGNVNVLCALENAIYMESGNLADVNRMYVYPLKVENGCIALPDVPGMATDVDEDYIRLYRVDK